MSVNRFYTGVFFVLLSATGFAVMPILAKYAYEGGANVGTLLFLRFGIASLLFFLYLWIKKGAKIVITRKQWFALIVYGGVMYALISTMYFQSLHYISGPLATLLLYTSPIFVVILSMLLEKEKFSKQVILAILLSIAGLSLVLGASFQEIRFYGVLLAVGSGLGYAIHIVLMNRMVKAIPPFLTTAYTILFTAVTQLVLGVTTNSFDFHFSGVAWASIIGLCFCSTILALLTFFLGLQLIGSTNASILSMFEPVITIILCAVILGESFTIWQMMGTAGVLIGAVIVVRGGQQRSQVEQLREATVTRQGKSM